MNSSAQKDKEGSASETTETKPDETKASNLPRVPQDQPSLRTADFVPGATLLVDEPLDHTLVVNVVVLQSPSLLRFEVSKLLETLVVVLK